MRDRANYAVLDGRALELFYAHWGGLGVPREVARGPEACLEFVRGQEEPEGWLDLAFMEGAIAMDVIRRVAICFGGPAAILYDRAVQRRFMERVRPLWEAHGWSLTWADDYAYGLMDFLGLPRSTAEMDLPFPEPSLEDCLVERAVTDVLLVRIEPTPVMRTVSRPLHALPALLPALLERWSELPLLEGKRLLPSTCALVIDAVARRLELLAPLLGARHQPYRTVERLQWQLPDWTVTAVVDERPVIGRLAACGLPLPGPCLLGVHAQPERNLAELDAIVDQVIAYAPAPALSPPSDEGAGTLPFG